MENCKNLNTEAQILEKEQSLEKFLETCDRQHIIQNMYNEGDEIISKARQRRDENNF